MLITDMTEKRRILDPGTMQRIWCGIIHLSMKRRNEDGESSCDYRTAISKKDLAGFIEDLFCKEDKLSYEQAEIYKFIEKAGRDGLIRILPHPGPPNNGAHKAVETPPMTNGDAGACDDDDCQVGLPTEPISRSAHDWYCFECHQSCNDENPPCKCNSCWRVFHRNCLAPASEFVRSILYDERDGSTIKTTEKSFSSCPICTLTQKYDSNYIGSRQLNQAQFNQLLSYTYTRFKAKSSHQLSHSTLRVKQLVSTKHNEEGDASFLSALTSSKIVPGSVAAVETNGDAESKSILSHTPRSVIAQLSLHYLCYKPVDLVDIEGKLANNQYQSIGEFFGDCWNLKHTIEVMSADQTITGQRRVREVLTRMLEVARYELKEMIGCVDCYRNSNNQDDKLWFCRPCDPPHALVFAKQKGYPFWPAKVIYPRNENKIDECNQLDVRFFGGNHERSLIDRSKIKDINSSLIELNITKPMPSLDRALSELRTYRGLLEKRKTNGSAETISNNHDSQSEKCNFVSTNLPYVDDEDEGADNFMTEDSSSDEQTENGDLTEPIKENGVGAELDATSTDNDSASNVNEDVSENSNAHETTAVPVKRKRGRPRKYSTTTSPATSSAKSSASTNRIRKKKVIYSPDDKTVLPLWPTNDLLGSSRSKRERKPKIFPNSTMPSLTMSSLSSKPLPIETSRSHRKQCPNLTTLTSSSSKKTKSDVRNSSLVASPSKPVRQTTATTTTSSPSSKYSMKRKEIERERQLIRARRKLMLNESLTPKHVPTVVATKSAPSAASPRPILTKPISNSTTPPVDIRSLNTVNSCVTRNSNDDTPHKIVTVKPESTGSCIAKLLSDPVQLSLPQKEYKPPSSALKPLNSEGETDDDKMDEESLPNPIENSDSNHSAPGTVKDVSAAYDDEEEPYLYDDDQLQEHINDYIEYQREKEMEEQQKHLNLYYQQQQLLQQQLAVKIMANIPIAESRPEPRTNPNEFQEFAPSPTTYIDFSTASVYAPTKKNQNLVNAYLHHLNTNNAIPPNQNDFLAQYILKKDDLEQEESQIQTTPLRKRGRPPKNQEDCTESAAKARSLIEKSYLQETACNRVCLTNNVKAFKKFREFLEAQSKSEIFKLKRELEESKQQVCLLNNKNVELEDLLKREKDLNKQFNPAVVTELEERYKRQISEVKKKQWCTLCEAEANFFCCFNTYYCSPQCQLKHWQSRHQLTCNRVKKMSGKTGNTANKKKKVEKSSNED